MNVSIHLTKTAHSSNTGKSRLGRSLASAGFRFLHQRCLS
jgi:hypothetical protein